MFVVGVWILEYDLPQLQQPEVCHGRKEQYA